MFAALLVIVSLARAVAGSLPYHAELPPPGQLAIETRMQSHVEELFRDAGIAPPTMDPSVVAACRVAAATLTRGTQGVLASEVLRASLEHAGVTDATTYPFTLRTVSGKAPLADLEALVDLHVLGNDLTHMGLAVALEPRTDGERVIVIVFLNRLVRLAPFGRHVPEGESPVLRGWLPEGGGTMSVLVGEPKGAVSESPVYPNPAGTFWSPILLRGGAGVYQVEVLAETELGIQVANLFPLYVGVPAPELPVMRLAPGDDEDATSAELEEKLALRVNQARVDSGLAPLWHNRILARAARRHSLDMVHRRYFGHRAPDLGDVNDRLQRQGLQASLASEVISIAPDISDAFASLLRSPSHRRVLLDPRLDHIGVGVTAVGRGTSRRLVISAALARIP